MEFLSRFEKNYQFRDVYKIPARVLGSFCRLLCSTPMQYMNNEGDEFMTFRVKVKLNKRGWQRSVDAMLDNCKGPQYRINQHGEMIVRGVANRKKLLWTIGRSKRIVLMSIGGGQCSGNLFLNEETPKDSVKEKPNTSNQLPFRGGYGYGYPPPYLGYGYPPPPPLLKPPGYGYEYGYPPPQPPFVFSHITSY